MSVTYHLEVFDGPLDLLLHLLAKKKVDIKDIQISSILDQYLEYIRLMEEFNLEVAAEFISMAAQLMYIKSKTLLPVYEEDGEEDPKAALIEALIEYQQIKEVSGILETMSEIGRDIFVKPPEILEKDRSRIKISGSADELLRAIETILDRAETRMPPPITSFSGIVTHETVSVNDKISQLISMFISKDFVDFEAIVLECKNRSDLVALFLAVLELSKDHKIVIEDKEDSGYTLRLAGPDDSADFIADEVEQDDIE